MVLTPLVDIQVHGRPLSTRAHRAPQSAEVVCWSWKHCWLFLASSRFFFCRLVCLTFHETCSLAWREVPSPICPQGIAKVCWRLQSPNNQPGSPGAGGEIRRSFTSIYCPPRLISAVILPTRNGPTPEARGPMEVSATGNPLSGHQCHSRLAPL